MERLGNKENVESVERAESEGMMGGGEREQCGGGANQLFSLPAASPA